MQNRIIIIMGHDLLKYPPMQSMLQILSEQKRTVHFIGYCSDILMRQRYEKENVVFHNLYNDSSGNFFSIFLKNRKYRKDLHKILLSLKITKDDLIIYEYMSSAYYIHDLLLPYKYVVLFYEFVNPSRSWKYDFVYPSYNINKFLNVSAGVIHCEYNRAQITRGLYNLEKMPYVLPNKPYIEESLLVQEIPDNVKNTILQIKEKTERKKIILYQGIFNSNERRLEEFCQAIKLLPDEYVLIAMGGGDSYYEKLKEHYKSEKILFLPFINSPYHLLITEMAHIGVLSYFPLDNSMAGVINPLYCAPNKIFEYSKYGKPMISNDIPGLRYIFDKYQCGKVVTYPFTAEMVASTILEISSNYSKYVVGSQSYFTSVDIKDILNKILHDMEYI